MNEKPTQTLKELLESQKLAVLATEKDGQPYASLVAFASTGDLREILFATTRSTRKFSNIVSEPRVALLVDSRTNQNADTHSAMAATALGKAEEVPENEKKPYLHLYLARHPHLSEFVSSPTCALLRVRIADYYMVRRFQEVTVIHIDS